MYSILQQEGYQKEGGPTYFIVVVLIPHPPSLLVPASEYSNVPATANTNFKCPLQGCFSLRGHLAFGRLLCRERK